MAIVVLNMTCGILVGSDQTQEWLLPWWWGHYSRHNAYPVAFVDFGLSEEKKWWCRERGELIPLRVLDFAAGQQEIAPDLIKQWEAQFGKTFWQSRGAWFKKPLACLQAPFEKSIWVDLDCEIRGPIGLLFDLADHPSGIAMANDSWNEAMSYQVYNSGVIVFRQNLLLLQEWAQKSFDQNHRFRGDQELLSHLIAEKQLEIAEVPPFYNWSRYWGEEPKAVIRHWHGEFGRSVIRHELWTKQLHP